MQEFDFNSRLKRICNLMEQSSIDALIATRFMSVCYVSGAFIPYRAAALVTADGQVFLYPSLIESERIRDESWVQNVIPWAPLPGMNWPELVSGKIKELGLDKGRIGVESEITPRLIEGVITDAEFRMLKERLPDAEFSNASIVMNEAVVVKEPAEIDRLRKAAEIADKGIKAALEAVEDGVTETAVLGAAERVMREEGSMWNWPITGGDEISSGYRGGYSRCGCTPPSNKVIRRGEIVMIDLHSTYELYYSDLSFNIVLGRASNEQKKMMETFTDIAYTLLDSVAAGVKIGDVAAAVMGKLEKTEYHPHVPPVFGHGLGIVGHEWYPPIAPFPPWSDYVLKENMVEELYLQLNKPGIGGLRLEVPVLVKKDGCEKLTKTPIEPEELIR
jgi:Xaa-Pro aminopeptidase